MRQDLLASLRELLDAELVARVKDLAARERGATVLLVAHLAELDTRDVHLRAGHGSLFVYCRDVLCLSEQEAYNRIAVARAARRFPVILELLEAGAINLTSVRLLGPHLTAANHAAVLERARGKTKLQVEEMAAALWPRPDAPAFVRKLPAPSASRSSTAGQPSSASVATPSLPAVPGPSCAPARRSAEVTPLAPDRYKVQVTIGGDTLEKLRLAKDLLRHAVPSGDEAAILDRALSALLADLAQQKFAAADRPRPAAGSLSGSRHIPAEVKRTVWLRDLGRCAFVGASGRRCSERAFLEFHHVKPYALGGEATAANIELRCRSHNAYEARLYFARGNGSGGGGSVREKPAPYGRASRDPGPTARGLLRAAGDSFRNGSPGSPAAGVRIPAPGRSRACRPPPRG